MARYSNDPRWITARFDSKCANLHCSTPVRKGQQTYYYPLVKATYCQSCGKNAQRDFESHAFDESMSY